MDNQEKLATRRRKTKQPHNTICVGHYAQANTNHINKTGAVLQTTGREDESNIVCMRNRSGHHTMELRTQRHIIGQHKKLKQLATRTSATNRGELKVIGFIMTYYQN